MSIASNLHYFINLLPEEVRLIAVSKFHPANELMEAYEAGQRLFGESRAQEMVAKYKQLPSDIEWHFIGPLQSNKVKDIAPFVSMIHSVDSLKLLSEINKQATKNERIIKVLLEIHVAREESKFGLTPGECIKLLNEYPPEQFPQLQICGLMGMATNTDDEEVIRNEFKTLHTLFRELKNSIFAGQEYFRELSMGMSDDFLLAVEEGSTMVRIGTSIFGERRY